MRILIDAICPGCGDVHVDVWVDSSHPEFVRFCQRCNLPLERHRAFAKAPGVKADSIPGGLWVEHGICNPDGTPRRYDSHSEMAKEAKRRGLERAVAHVDDSPHTQRFV